MVGSCVPTIGGHGVLGGAYSYQGSYDPTATGMMPEGYLALVAVATITSYAHPYVDAYWTWPTA